ncbi:beta-1,4-N-acetylgalactosaminyltransferase bre-4-like [Palaemon carinicauda]|uniref:beta-1,4-N-acetylgalactosaminyltransferase bre-4-like n=1 Tax=Palaemon carinicauda TaxID=392227 RepID=UPI0035B5BF21
MILLRNKVWKSRLRKLVLLAIGLYYISFIQRYRSHFSEFLPALKYKDLRVGNESLRNNVTDITPTIVNSTYKDDTNNTNNRSITENPICPLVPPKLVGPLIVNHEAPPLEEQERLHPELEPGGRFLPADCRARHRVAIIVPFRDRLSQVPPFLHHMHPILQRQQLEYVIYIVEQAAQEQFNKGILMNAAVIESLKQYEFDCFVFHDVDLLPENDRNLYTCPDQPRHLAQLVDTLRYKLLSLDMFGGVVALTTEQFKTVNGFSNSFWGWGGEDDDMGNRVKFHGLFITRYPHEIGRYTMLKHKKEKPSGTRFTSLTNGTSRYLTDGINSVKYDILDVQLRPLYTWISVNFTRS